MNEEIINRAFRGKQDNDDRNINWWGKHADLVKRKNEQNQLPRDKASSLKMKKAH